MVVVEPGAVNTEMADRGAATATDLAERMNPEQQRRYGGLVEAVVAHQAAAFTRTGLPADEAGSVVAEAATARRPRTRYAIGRDAAILTRLVRILPDRILDRLLAVNLRGYLPEEGA